MQEWIPLEDRRPKAADADSLGDVIFLRSGLAVLGRLASGIPSDATHWQPTARDVEIEMSARHGMPGLTAAERSQAEHDIIAQGAEFGVPLSSILAVMARYHEPNRAYHGFSHLARMFLFARQAEVRLSRAQYLAVLFHDAVYVPGAQDGMNEKLSALLLAQFSHGMDETEIRLARSIVLDTILHRATTEAAKVVLDLDLAGLGQSRDWFERDSRMVFEEVRHLVPSWEEYTVKRAAFFETLLKRQRLYVSGHFDHLEAPARENMLATTLLP